MLVMVVGRQPSSLYPDNRVPDTLANLWKGSETYHMCYYAGCEHVHELLPFPF